MGGLLLSLPLYNKDRQFCRNSLIIYELFFGNMKYFLLEINQLARAIENQSVSRALSFSTPALPPYKDTKKSPYIQGVWITFFINIFDFFSVFRCNPLQCGVCAAHDLNRSKTPPRFRSGTFVYPIYFCNQIKLLTNVKMAVDNFFLLRTQKGGIY